MIFLLDTNVISERAKAEKNMDPGALDFFRRCPAENVRLPSMVLAEVVQGVENNPTPALRRFLADLLNLPLLAFGEAEAIEWGRMTSAALRAGVAVQARDSIIAATATANRCVVATRNGQHFKPLGAQVFDPFKDRLPA